LQNNLKYCTIISERKSQRCNHTHPACDQELFFVNFKMSKITQLTERQKFLISEVNRFSTTIRNMEWAGNKGYHKGTAGRDFSGSAWASDLGSSRRNKQVYKELEALVKLGHLKSAGPRSYVVADPALAPPGD
jgi:hypothetical protein